MDYSAKRSPSYLSAIVDFGSQKIQWFDPYEDIIRYFLFLKSDIYIYIPCLCLGSEVGQGGERVEGYIQSGSERHFLFL